MTSSLVDHNAGAGPTIQPLLVEVFTGSGCEVCQRATALVQAIATEFDVDQVRYREVNVVDEIDYAVALGVLNSSAVALDGDLVFSLVPSRDVLRDAIASRLEGRATPKALSEEGKS